MRLRTIRWNALLLPAAVALLAATEPAMAVQHTAAQSMAVRAAAQAAATASPACSPSPSAASITLPAVSISPSQSNGLIGSPVSVSVTFDCSVPFLNDSDYSDNFTLMTGSLAPFDTTTTPPSGNGGIMFTTNLQGIEAQLTATQVQASNGGNGPDGQAGWAMGSIACAGYTNSWSCTPANTITVTFTAQLVKTGTVVAGTVNSIKLLQFFDQDTYQASSGGANKTYAPSASFGTLTLNSVKVSANACTVTVDPTVVTLPAVLVSAFTGAGTTTGQTPFNVQLNCPAGTNLSITLATASPQTGTTSVIAPTSGSGYAGNVGVQLLNSSGNPITFGTAISEGKTTAGAMNLPFSARYYQTASGVTAGQVTATATYTLTYQ
ncbi:fimbrial protein [Rhodanobacter hydrolyticus]|uniref:Fimbrial protein n=1 Tax=Rhodanobacter hydrolyticus TaxID=2250595 RepID=A0ABW8J629_9GAMM